MRLIYYNNKITEESQLFLPADERGFLYGDGLFETLRAYQGKLFAADRHAKRLLASAKALKIASRHTAEELQSILQEVCDCNNHKIERNLYLRATLSRGCGYGPDIKHEFSANLLVYVKPLTGFSAKLYSQGISLITSSQRRSARANMNQHKSLSYLPCLLARCEATEQQADEALILDTDEYVLEGACSNIFAVSGNKLLTPSLDRNLLPGITRNIVLEIAAKSGISTLETDLQLRELKQASEIFITNTLQELVPVRSIDEKIIGTGKPGQITLHLLAKYRKVVKAQCFAAEA